MMRPLFWLLALPLGHLSAQASFLEGTPGFPRDVVIAGPPEERPPMLQGITLLPIECVGRTRLTELLDGSARRRTDIPGASRLLLPNEKGSLYKYWRPESVSQPAAFGYLFVGTDGRARSAFELPGTGPLGLDDPLEARVAVAAGGSSILAASSLEAGGDLWEVNLLSGAVLNRTPTLAPQAFLRNGLVLLATWGLGVSSTGVFRFERGPGQGAIPVPMGIPPQWFGEDVVSSADSSTVAFLAGESVSRALVYTCRATGDAAQASDTPMEIRGAGFLPESPRGPTLALSTDGSWVAWREGGSSGECFARETLSGSRLPDQHLTGSSHFESTLNDTGVIAFFDPDSLVFVMGRDSATGIERADLFRLDLAASGSFTATNLSQTSDVLRPPFDYGELRTRDGLFRLPGGTPAFLSHDSEEGRLLLVKTSGAVVEILDKVTTLDGLEVAGDHLVAEVTRSPEDLLAHDSLNLLQIPFGGLNPILVELPNGCRLSRSAASRTNSIYASILEFQSGARLGRLPVPSPNGFGVSPLLHTYGPTTGLTADGSVLALVDNLAFVWSDLGAQLVRNSRVPSMLLPGL